MPLTPKANLLRALHHVEPDHVPWAGEGALRLVDHVWRKPPRSGADEWGVTWAPLPTSYQVGAGEPAESYPVVHPASTAAEALTLPVPDPAASGLFDGLLDGIDRSETLVVGQHGAGPFDRFVQLLGMPAAMIALLREPHDSARRHEPYRRVPCRYRARLSGRGRRSGVVGRRLRRRRRSADQPRALAETGVAGHPRRSSPCIGRPARRSSSTLAGGLKRSSRICWRPGSRYSICRAMCAIWPASRRNSAGGSPFMAAYQAI